MSGNSVVFAVTASGGVAGEAASWTCALSNTGIATVSVTSTGCQATGVAAGSVVITAAVSKSGETVNVGSQLTVTDPLKARMAPASGKVGVGNSIVFTITTTGGLVDAQLTWRCETSDANIATVTVTEAGCEATGVARGDAVITAVVSGGPGDLTVTAQAELTVSTSRSAPAGIGDTVFVRADRFFNGEADLRFILLGVDIQPLPDTPDLLWATATMDILLIEAHSRYFTAPISPLNWSSWSLSQSGQECFYGLQDGLTGISVGPEPLPIAPGTNWTTDVSVFIPAEASNTAIELLAFQARAPEFFTLGNCFGPDPGTSERPGEAWFLLRGGAR